jgi:hypothetical protein
VREDHLEVGLRGKALPNLPPEFEPVLAPLLEVIASLDDQMRSYDRRIGEAGGVLGRKDIGEGGERVTGNPVPDAYGEAAE